MLTRRKFITTATAAPFATALAGKAIASIDVAGGTLTTVSDGTLTLPYDMMFGHVPADDLAPYIQSLGISPGNQTPPCNVTLYQDGTNTVLFDAGSGFDFMPTAGELLDNLDAIGVAPEDVTHVVFTHAHPDHIWGVLDDFGDPAFYEATHMMGRAEWDYWWNPETVNTIGADRQAFAVGAKRRMEAIEDVMEFFDPGDEILPGVGAFATYGHTPGHISFEIGDAIISGDATGNSPLSIARPEWVSGSDQDQEMGAASRTMLMDRLVSEQKTLIGFHQPNGGIGRIEKLANGEFTFVPT